MLLYEYVLLAPKEFCLILCSKERVLINLESVNVINLVVDQFLSLGIEYRISVEYRIDIEYRDTKHGIDTEVRILVSEQP